MKRAALSDLVVRKAKPKDKRYMLNDGRGLVLEVMPTGRKYWRLIFRVEGLRKTQTLGEYNSMSLVEARQKADELRAALKHGEDPREVVNPPHKPTFAEVAEEWLSRQAGRWTEAYTETVQHRLSNHLYAALGARPLSEITASEVLTVLRVIEAKGTVDTARRVKQIYGAVARYGIACGLCEADVSAALTGALAAPKSKNFAAITDKNDIQKLLYAMRAYQGYAVVRPALWFSIYTLARPGEVRHAEWTEVDLEGATWTIPAEKMKMRRPHAVPLSRQAVELLRGLEPLTGAGRWVFPSARNDGRPMSENAVRVALRSMGFTNDQMTAHGFRALGSTMLNEMGFRPDTIEAALAHAQTGVRGVYNRSVYLEERRQMMQAWADWLDGLIDTE